MGNNSKWIRIRIYIREEEIVLTLKLIVENLRTQDKKKRSFIFPILEQIPTSTRL